MQLGCVVTLTIYVQEIMSNHNYSAELSHNKANNDNTALVSALATSVCGFSAVYVRILALVFVFK